ncbi:MAG: response regulator [Isosphaeraceae bacterium]
MDERILVVDESELVCQQLSQILSRRGWSTWIAHDGTTALEVLVEQGPSLAIVDLGLPGISAGELLAECRNRKLTVPFLVMAGPARFDAILEAREFGAYECVNKPIDASRLEFLVDQALGDARLSHEIESLRNQRGRRLGGERMAEVCPGLREALERLTLAARSSGSVLIRAEPGTRVGRIVEALHLGGRPRSGRLVRIDCRSTSASLALRWATTLEASEVSVSRAHLADTPSGGMTIWLESIEAVEAEQVADLLGELQRVDVQKHQIVGTTRLSVPRVPSEPQPSTSLLSFFNGTEVSIPPIRERAQDLQGLAEEWLAESVGPDQTRIDLPAGSTDPLSTHTWPGNEKEFEAFLVRAMMTNTGDPASEAARLALPIWEGGDRLHLEFDPDRPLPEITRGASERIERAYLTRVLAENQGRITPSAAQAGLTRRSISAKLSQYGIDKSRFKSRTARTRGNNRAMIDE